MPPETIQPHAGTRGRTGLAAGLAGAGTERTAVAIDHPGWRREVWGVIGREIGLSVPREPARAVTMVAAMRDTAAVDIMHIDMGSIVHG